MTDKKNTAKNTPKRTLRTVVRDGQLPSHPLRIEPEAYAAKFSHLLDALERDPGLGDNTGLLVAHPGILGDNYEELLQSLSLLAEAGFALLIADPQPGSLRLGRLNRARPRPRATHGAGERNGA